MITIRSSCLEVFCEKVALTNFEKSTEKELCRSFPATLLKNRMETASFISPKIWDTLPNGYKDAYSLENFKENFKR